MLLMLFCEGSGGGGGGGGVFCKYDVVEFMSYNVYYY